MKRFWFVRLLLLILMLIALPHESFARSRYTMRSYSYRPTYRSYTPRTRVIERTRTVHHYDSGGGNGLVTGMVVGSMLSHQNQQPNVVVVQGQPQQAAEPYTATTQAPIQTQEQAPPAAPPAAVSHGTPWWAWALLLLVVAGGGLLAVKRAEGF